MKPKIILVDPLNNETPIATMRSTVEAFQAASLFQAIIPHQGHTYYVDHYIKGKGLRRTQPDSIITTISNSVILSERLRSYFK